MTVAILRWPRWNHFPGDDLLTPLNRRHGLPIGNLTSQFFANWYLNDFDHFVKEQLGVKKYLRFVDDFALFSDDRGFLQDCRVALEDYLAGLRLTVHPIKSQLFETRQGCNFLGFRMLPDRIRVRAESLRRARRRCRRLQGRYARRQVDLGEVIQSLQSWEAHLKHGDSWRLRRKIFAGLVFTRSRVLQGGEEGAGNVAAAGRFVDQQS